MAEISSPSLTASSSFAPPSVNSVVGMKPVYFVPRSSVTSVLLMPVTTPFTLSPLYIGFRVSSSMASKESDSGFFGAGSSAAVSTASSTAAAASSATSPAASATFSAASATSSAASSAAAVTVSLTASAVSSAASAAFSNTVDSSTFSSSILFLTSLIIHDGVDAPAVMPMILLSARALISSSSARSTN